MDTLWSIIREPFVWGLALGLLITAFVWKSSLTAKATQRREIKRLQDEGRELQGHLNTQLKINASGNESLEKELKELRTQNENLRVNLSSVQNKPGRAESRQLQINENAIRIMREQAPGFAPAWEQALHRAEADHEAGEGGLKKLMRKVIPGIGHSSSTPPAEDSPKSDED
jgi:hypothetical protein